MSESNGGPGVMEAESATPKLPEAVQVSDRVSARRGTMDDVDLIVALSADSDVTHNIPWARILAAGEKTPDESMASWVEKWDEGKQFRYVVEVDGQPAGYFGVWRSVGQEHLIETGSAMLENYRGQGVIPEVAAAVEPHIVEQLGMTELVSHVRPTNESSQRQLLKRGYTDTGATRVDSEGNETMIFRKSLGDGEE